VVESSYSFVPIGPRVIEVLDLAYRARRPVLLEGPTGIGKSQIVGEFAKAAGLGIVVLDLSLLEPPDLIGLPTITGDRTRYASPAELPTTGQGILMLEELNRAEVPVMQPALQLLSARRLHAYELPAGWCCVASVNPEGEGYQVNRMDAALRSRFLQVSVCADRVTWLQWATRTNVHPVVMRVIRDHEEAFEQASPRSWTYASDLLHTLRPDEIENAELLRVALRGFIPAPWAMVITEALTNYPVTPEIDADTLFGPEGVVQLQQLMQRLQTASRSDAVAMIASRIRLMMSGEDFVGCVATGAVTLASLESLLAALPGDLREQCLESAVESPAATDLLRSIGYEPRAVLSSYETSPFRAELQTWREEMKLHRIRLVVVAVQRFLERHAGRSQDPAELRAWRAQLSPLIFDAGPLGKVLMPWLEAPVAALGPVREGT
jgi:hypothetical protein